ncbi:BMP family ABC transporter substrate-binding protein [Mycoplasmopsis felifaucium]|uniref:BMP family ABC transporter substrate-binding protein n=1 Tax=Mycoplasmopsis felifaucium TaxID=35768 RepID=UPI000485ADC6|nr:BMP family ABC transporter substrate-binding protein [Mycoplasmopsis felifaucium]
MNKKILLGLAPVATLAPVAMTVSCGETDEFFKEGQMKDANGQVVEGRKSISTLGHIASNPSFKLADNQKNNKTVFITDEGTVEDKSFNQSGWEAVHKLSYELGLDIAKSKGNKKLFNSYRQPEAGKLLPTYEQVIGSGQYKYIVLCGFTHGKPLETAFKNEKLLKLIEEKGMIFICVDFAPSSDDATTAEKLKKHSISVMFDTAVAGYMAGYGLANYFAEKYPTDAAKRTIGAFGGIPWPAVSDFIIGTFAGIEEANKANAGKTTHSINTRINLDSGFESGSQKSSQAINEIKAAQAWYPVAGSLSVQASKLLDSDRFLIGVDADQAVSLTNVRIYTSVMKLVGQAIYNILGNLYTYGDVSKIPKLATWATDHTAKMFGYNVQDATQRYVNVAPAHLLNAENDKLAEKSLNAAVAYYQANASTINSTLAGLQERFKPSTGIAYPAIFQQVTDGLAAAINAQK